MINKPEYFLFIREFNLLFCRMNVHIDLLWIEAHGSIPEDHAVVFADGDSDNLSLNNLECIHKGEVALRNKTGYSSVPSELRPIAKNVVRLRMRAAQATRDFKEAQQ